MAGKAGKIVDIVLILIVNLLIGGCVGLTGIAGFLLPMFYTGFLGIPSVQALALSFAAFLISGVFGSVNYYRSKNLDIRTAMIMSAGSIAGAVAGVRINLLIPEDTMKVILYAVVLISGVSILLRREKADSRKKVQKRNPAVFVLLGFVTGAVCAASGAGGPILVMPLLTLLGFPAHTSVGMSLFNSIFIALPAMAGYFYNAAFERDMLILLPFILIAHAVGVIAGSKNAVRINQTILKRIVAVASICIACIKLFPV